MPKKKEIEAKIKEGKHFRSLELKRELINEEDRTVELSFSSETPIRRWFGKEILDHSKGSVDLKRLREGGAVLVEHDRKDHVGVVESVEIGADRKGRAVVRFGKTPRAEDVFQDIKDGIRRLVSVDYHIHKVVLESDEGDVKTYRAMKWEPFEISIVSVPADTEVGVGRSENDNPETEDLGRIDMPEVQIPQAEGQRSAAPPQAPDVDIQAVESNARKLELKRTTEIFDIGEKFDCVDLARSAISEGKSVDDFREIVMDKKFNARAVETPDADLGMPEKDIQNYSLMRAIRAATDNDWSEAGLELDASRAVAKVRKKQPRSFFVPTDVLNSDHGVISGQRADYLNTGVAAEGGNLVGTTLMMGSFIDMLKNAMMVKGLGATVLANLVGNLA
ncbi:MAG: hypothetical protein GY841_20795, partial [FCB group bacterium]|nr:hypothetical protein [FCB group bacterium]